MLKTEEFRVNLTPAERKVIRERLRREPNHTELSMIDVMWSEHCSYKSSRPLLKLLPTASPRVIIGPGYDAGVVDIGDGYVAAFKLESHNHPSAIEPYNGAATGVGGIVRDILSMGCRPVALLDALRFGSLTNGRNRWLLQNVVSGIADYGNRIGVPTVGGELEFDESFEGNCLVNVACIGFGKRSDIILPKFEREGDLVALVGGSTGRDGIHGATFASRTMSEKSEEDRPAVQIADAFTEKLVLEATLEALKTGFVHAVKDLGGGGLTCAASEMAHKGGKGVRLELEKINTREAKMLPVELLLSESQERMLLAVDPRGFDRVKQVFEKYELPFSVIGRVTSTGQVEASIRGQRVVDLPAEILAEAPVAFRDSIEPQHLRELRDSMLPSAYRDLSEALTRIISSPNLASKEYVFRQYDHEVGVRTVVKPGDGDAAVLRLIERDRAVAITADCNSNHCYLDPYNGTAGAVAQAAQNITAVGATPIAVVDGCNFGNPERPEVYGQFSKAIEGMKYMLSELQLPCVGGNVSFYNEDEQTHRTVKPTTIIVALGVIDDLEWITTIPFKRADEMIIAVGTTDAELGGSEYAAQLLETEAGRPPRADGTRILATLNAVQAAIREGLVTAAHDCSKGGLAAAVSLMSLKSGVGAEINLDKLPKGQVSRTDELLFSESYGRFVLSTSREDASRLLQITRKRGAPTEIIGSTGGRAVSFKKDSKSVAECEASKLAKLWRESIPKTLGA